MLDAPQFERRLHETDGDARRRQLFLRFSKMIESGRGKIVAQQHREPPAGLQCERRRRPREFSAGVVQGNDDFECGTHESFFGKIRAGFARQQSREAGF